MGVTSKEREKNEKILKKSRNWVDRMYGMAENYNNNNNKVSTDTDSSSPPSKKDVDYNNPTEEASTQMKPLRMTPNSENRSNDESFEVAVDLPGVDRSDVDVTL